MAASVSRLRTGVAALAACLVSGALAGCGFTPLYATPGLSPALASIKIEGPQNRTGYLLRQKLDDQLAHDDDTPARYRLTLSDVESRYARGLFVNNVASRYETSLTVIYELSDAVTGKVLLQGRAPVEVSYDAATPPYSVVAASQDGEVRAANQAAILIRLQLSRYFDHLAEPPAPPSVVSAQLPPPAVAGPRAPGPDVPAASVPGSLGFGGSSADPQTINAPPPTIPVEPTPQTPQ